MATLFADEEIEARRQENLPYLEGSEKQVRWATYLRRAVLAEAGRLVEDARRLADVYDRTHKHGQAKAARAYADRIAEWSRDLVRMNPHASFWIEHRDNTLDELLEGAQARPGHTVDRNDPVPEYLRS